MVRTDNRPLEQAPNALNSVSVNVANNPFFGGVINPLMFRVGILNSPISRHFIGVDRFRVRRSVVVNKLVEHGLGSVRDDLQSNHSVTLDRSDCDGLVAFVTPTVTPPLSATVDSVNFSYSAKTLAVNFTPGRT